jgi:predicted transcriptional regulator of viral defense system
LKEILYAQLVMRGALNVSMDITKTAGISEVGRSRLGQLVRAIPGPIRVADAARALDLDPRKTTWLLSAWVRRGWLQRIARGVYVPVSLETQAGTRPAADPWVVATAVFEPCYVTGWSAAGNWDLTEQLYRVTAVVSARRLRNRRPTAGGAEFLVITRPLPAEGTVAVWRDGVPVRLADPALTVIDMIDDPRLGPGIREASRTISEYLRSQRRDDIALIRYGDARGNGAVFKRLGLLVERLAPNEIDLMNACRERLTEGYARLDPGVDAPGTRRKRWRVIENVRIPRDERG